MPQQNSIRRLPGDKSEAEEIASILRVNHAGEYGARRIYLGQLAVLKGHKEISEMYRQEEAHLKYFEAEVARHRVRPTVLQPLWHRLGFVLGVVTAAMGEKAAMACTVAVEDVIGEHYQSQLKTLARHKGQKQLAKKIAQFRDDELGHRDTGIKLDAESTPGYWALTMAIRSATKAAIWLSRRI